MKGMHRIALFALLGTAAFAQTEAPAEEKAPAELEQTVRARVDQFYAHMVKAQYRQAEALISEDTKDYYYAGAKPDIRKYEVLTLEFSEHLTRAKAMTKVTEPVTTPGFPPTEMTVTIPSYWRLENGNWLLYEDPDKVKNPSGLQTKIQDAISNAAAATGTTPPGMPHDLPKDPSFALGKVLVDKENVKLKEGASETVLIANSSQGPFTLEPGAPLPGIEAKLDKTELGRGDKAILTLTAGKDAKGGFYYLRVMPTGEPIRIIVTVQ
jgi:hypothetical protein